MTCFQPFLSSINCETPFQFRVLHTTLNTPGADSGAGRDNILTLSGQSLTFLTARSPSLTLEHTVGSPVSLGEFGSALPSLPVGRSYTSTLKNTHTRMHACAHPDVCFLTHVHMCTLPSPHRVHAHTHMLTDAHTHAHTRRHAHTHSC